MLYKQAGQTNKTKQRKNQTFLLISCLIPLKGVSISFLRDATGGVSSTAVRHGITLEEEVPCGK